MSSIKIGNGRLIGYYAKGILHWQEIGTVKEKSKTIHDKKTSIQMMNRRVRRNLKRELLKDLIDD